MADSAAASVKAVVACVCGGVGNVGVAMVSRVVAAIVAAVGVAACDSGMCFGAAVQPYSRAQLCSLRTVQSWSRGVVAWGSDGDWIDSIDDSKTTTCHMSCPVMSITRADRVTRI